MRIFRIASLLVLTALTGSPASATSFIERPFPESVENAPIIVRGRAGQSQAEYGVSAEGSRRIYTYTDLEITEVIKGDPGASRIRIRELGGEKNGIGMQVSGTAHFEPGEDFVIFLEPRSTDGSFPVRGMMMGKFNLTRNEQGQEILFGPGIRTFAPEQPSEETSEQPGEQPNEQKESQDDTSTPQKWTLESLRRLVKAQAGQPAESKNAADSPTPASSPAQQPSSSPQAPRLQPQPLGELEELPGEPARFPTSVKILASVALGAVAWAIRRARSRKN